MNGFELEILWKIEQWHTIHSDTVLYIITYTAAGNDHRVNQCTLVATQV